jgi:hypothetical protein
LWDGKKTEDHIKTDESVVKLCRSYTFHWYQILCCISIFHAWRISWVMWQSRLFDLHANLWFQWTDKVNLRKLHFLDGFDTERRFQMFKKFIQ